MYNTPVAQEYYKEDIVVDEFITENRHSCQKTKQLWQRT
jgi:hypothetical protein